MKPIIFQALGADPEVFLQDAQGLPVSAEGLLGGTKHDPKDMGIGEGFFIQEDGVAAEYNIPASTSAKDFSLNIAKGLSYINKEARRRKLKLAIVPALYFQPHQLESMQAKVLGCEPDYDIWKLSVNPRPTPPESLRTAAGHLHLSWTTPDEEQVKALIRALDVTLGVPSILVTKKSERRSLYGRAGAFRPKEYGAEYRTLDNFWLSKKKWAEHIFKMVQETIKAVNKEGEFLQEDLEIRKDNIQAAINDHDRDEALALMRYFNVQPFPL